MWLHDDCVCDDNQVRHSRTGPLNTVNTMYILTDQKMFRLQTSNTWRGELFVLSLPRACSSSKEQLECLVHGIVARIQQSWHPPSTAHVQMTVRGVEPRSECHAKNRAYRLVRTRGDTQKAKVPESLATWRIALLAARRKNSLQLLR